MHIHLFCCHWPADYLTKHPLKLPPKHISKRAEVSGATAVDRGHCFQCERVSLISYWLKMNEIKPKEKLD